MAAESVTPDGYDDEDFMEPPTCSLCDGLGHGYPGGGPCPLEVGYAGYADDLDREEW